LEKDNRAVGEVSESAEKDGFNELYNEAVRDWIHQFRSLNFPVLGAQVKSTFFDFQKVHLVGNPELLSQPLYSKNVFI